MRWARPPRRRSPDPNCNPKPVGADLEFACQCSGHACRASAHLILTLTLCAWILGFAMVLLVGQH